MRRARIAGAWHPWGVTLLVVAITLLVAGIPGASNGLQYDRSLIGQGQWWRLVTSHWVHWTPDHLTWDLLAFAALTAAAIRLSRGRALATVALASCLIPVCIWVFNPELVRYRGLSGLASALYVLVVLEVWGRIPRGESRGKGVVAWLLLVGFAAKVVYELVSGNTLFVESMGEGIRAVPLAHGVGGAIGAVVFGVATVKVGWVVQGIGVSV